MIKNFTDIQLEMIDELDKKYQEVNKSYRDYGGFQVNLEKPKESIDFANLGYFTDFFYMYLEVIHWFINRAITNDGTLMFRIGNLLTFKPPKKGAFKTCWRYENDEEYAKAEKELENIGFMEGW